MTENGRLDQVITNLVDVFIEYAKDDGKKCKLNKDELSKVLETEMKNEEVKGKIKSNDIDEAMDMIDKNNDGEVNFREFGRFVSILAKCYYHKKSCKGGKKGKGGKKDAEKDEDGEPS